MTTLPSQAAPAAERPWALQTYRVLAFLFPPLIVVQALLAGEWLAGHDVIRVHETLGGLLAVAALVQIGLAAAAGLRRDVRTRVIAVSVLLFVLIVVQYALGKGGFGSANQARALHLPNGLLVLGLAAYCSTLAENLARRS